MQDVTNVVSLTGHLGKDVEIKTLENGSKVAKVSVATNEYYKNSKGEKVTEATWHNLTAWNKTAELMDQLLRKGSHVQIQGALKNDAYKTKEGETRNYSYVKVSNFRVLSKKEEAMPF